MAKKKKTEREAEKREREFREGQQRLVRRRNLVMTLGFIPLLGLLGCDLALPLGPVCGLPPDVWLLVLAAIVGSFIGLTIRLLLERRKFEQSGRGAA
jgi:hypothetical protein